MKLMRAVRRHLPDWRLGRVYLACFLAQFAVAFSLTMLYPFLPFMTEFLVPSSDETSIGQYVGFIASAVFGGKLFGCFIWGVLADSKGRKPVLVFTLLAYSLSSASFGFSVHIAMAFVTRFLMGFFDGITGTVKAVIGETADDSNQALGLSVLATSWGIGLILGPAVGAALSDPLNQYNITVSNSAMKRYFALFPYSLPGIVNLVVCILALVFVLLFLPETLNKRKVKENWRTNSTSSPNDQSSLSNHAKQPTGSNHKQPPCGQEEHHSESEEVIIDVNTTNPMATSSGHGRGSDDKCSALPGGVKESIVELDITAAAEEKPTRVDAGEHPRVNSKQEKEEDMNEIEGKAAEETMLVPWPRHRSSVLLALFNRRYSFSPSYVRVSSKVRKLSQKRKDMQQASLNHTSPAVHSELDEVEVASTGGPECGQIEECRSSLAGKKRFCSMWLCVGAVGHGFKLALQNAKEFFCDRVTCMCLILYAIFNFVAISFDELYPLWAYTLPHNGGLGLSLHEIGITLTVAGCVLLPVLLFAFALMERCFGGIKTLQICSNTFMFAVIVLPSLHLINYKILLWIVLCGTLILTRFAYTVMNAAVAFLVNNSVTFDKLGSVNGMAMASASIFRIAAPLTTGWIFSLSLSDTLQSAGFPVDYHLMFIVLGILLLSISLIAAMLPPTINQQKVEP